MSSHLTIYRLSLIIEVVYYNRLQLKSLGFTRICNQGEVFMYPIIWHLGKINIYTHGLMIAAGATIGGLLIYYLAKRENLNTRFLFDLLVYSLFAGIIGARIVYVIFYYYQFSNWKEMFFIWHGGLVSFGGLLFGFLAAWLILKKRHEPVLKWFDIGIIGLLVAWVIGRVGCFLNGDIPGIQSNSKITIWGQVPVSLIEAGWSFMVAMLLFSLLIWQKNFLDKFKDGFLFFIGLGSYFLGRAVIDIFRQDRVLFLSIKTGQLTSMIILLLIILVLIFHFQVLKKGGQNVRKNY